MAHTGFPTLLALRRPLSSASFLMKDAAAVFKALLTLLVPIEPFSNIPEPHEGRQSAEGLPTLAVS